MSFGHCACGSLACFTIFWMVKCPHACPIVVVGAPKILSVLERLDKGGGGGGGWGGGLFFQAHLSADFFLVSFVFFCSFVFSAAGFLPVVLSLLVLSVPQCSFFKELISAVIATDMIYIKTQVHRLLRYYSPAPRNIARSDWVTQNITHNMTSSRIQPYGLHSL